MAWIDPRYAEHQRRRWTRHDAHLWVRHDAHRFRRPAVEAKAACAPPAPLPLAIEEKRADPAIEAVRRVLALCRLERARSLAHKAGFDPDQTRDEQGRWTGVGGQSAAGARSTELSSAQRRGGIPRALWNLTVRQFVSRYCKASVNHELPGQFENVTIADLLELKKGGDAAANRCYKILNQQRFRK